MTKKNMEINIGIILAIVWYCMTIELTIDAAVCNAFIVQKNLCMFTITCAGN